MNCNQHLDKNSEEFLTTSRLRFARAFMKNHVFNMSKFEIWDLKFEKRWVTERKISMLKTSHIQHTKKNAECHKDFKNTENSQQKKNKICSEHHFWLQESNVLVLNQNQNWKHLQKNLSKNLIIKNLYSIC